MTKEESNILLEYSLEEYSSGVILILFDCKKRFASVFRNANDIFTLTIMKDGVVLEQEVLLIPELAKIGTGEYYTSYSTEKEQAVIHCVPYKFYEHD